MNSTNQSQLAAMTSGNRSDLLGKRNLFTLGILVLAALSLMFAAYQIVKNSRLRDLIGATELQLVAATEEDAESQRNVADLQTKIAVFEAGVTKSNESLDRKTQLTLQLEKTVGQLEADVTTLKTDIDSMTVSQRQFR